MGSFIAQVLLGAVCITLGRSNMKGNIASIHRYHRRRISEENKLPFGKMVGLGTIIIGCSIITFALLSLAAEQLHIDLLLIIGSAIVILGLAIGLGMSFYAMIRYNKGVF